MFIVNIFKNLFSAMVVILLALCALFGIVALASGQGLLGIGIAVGGSLLVVMVFGMYGVIIDMHNQLVSLNANLTNSKKD
jgi:hypothetical protein